MSSARDLRADDVFGTVRDGQGSWLPESDENGSLCCALKDRQLHRKLHGGCLLSAFTQPQGYNKQCG